MRCYRTYPKSFFNSFIFAFLPHAITVSLLLVHREQVSSHDDDEENDSDTGGGGGNNADGRNNNSSSNTRSSNNRAGAAAAATGDNIELEERGIGRGGDLLARETTLVRLILQRGSRSLGEYLTRDFFLLSHFHVNFPIETLSKTWKKALTLIFYCFL